MDLLVRCRLPSIIAIVAVALGLVAVSPLDILSTPLKVMVDMVVV
jgi:type III secretory pathway component EscR